MTTNPPLSRRSTTHANDELPPWLTTKEAAFQVALWLMRQPDRALHHMRILAELAEVTGDIREALLAPPVANPPRRTSGGCVARSTSALSHAEFALPER
jgi:hypothetical protein